MTKTVQPRQLQPTEDYFRFQKFIVDNNKLWENLIIRLYDEFDFEKEQVKQLLVEKFSELGKTTCKLSGRVFTVHVQLTPKKIGEFKLKKTSFAYMVLVNP